MQEEFQERPSPILLKSGPPVQGWEQDAGHPLVQEVGGFSTRKAPADPSLLHKLVNVQTQSGCSLG